MRELWHFFLGIFGPRKSDQPPAGVIELEKAIEELQASTQDLRNKLQQYPEYYERNPITERVVPRDYYTPKRNTE